jgi:hypothetical protein
VLGIAGTLEGVVLTSVLSMTRDAGKRCHGGGDERDGQVAALGSAAQMLMGQARLLRALDSRPVRSGRL